MPRFRGCHVTSLNRLWRQGSTSAGSLSIEEESMLRRWLESKPDVILRRFKAYGLTCLAELPLYDAIARDNPASAERIRAVAALFGIPERHVSSGAGKSEAPSRAAGSADEQPLP